MRESILLGGALLVGLVVIPLAIWLVGNRLLGPYTHGPDPRGGGPLALLGDFFAGLRSGALTFWAVALGPVLFVLFARLVKALLWPGRPAPPQEPPEH